MAQPDNVSADDMVAAIDTGGRDPVGAMRNLIPVVAFIWALFQMYIASNFPFTLTESRYQFCGHQLQRAIDTPGVRLFPGINGISIDEVFAQREYTVV